MNMYANPTPGILPFPSTRVAQATACRAKIRQHDLLELTPPGAFIGDISMLLCGENLLLPTAGEPRHRYACCAYLVSADGARAVPVLGCRPWFHAPLPAETAMHPVWEDLGGGLLEAARCLDTATFDLNGAVAAARSWLAYRHGEVASRAGSVLLMGHNTPVFCAATPAGPPPQAATARTLAFAPVTLRPVATFQQQRLTA